MSIIFEIIDITKGCMEMKKESKMKRALNEEFFHDDTLFWYQE